MNNSDIQRTILGLGIIVISFSLFVSLQPLPFTYAQNSTSTAQNNASNSDIYIPPTVSKEAQEILKNLTMNMPTIVTPDSDDLEGWQKLSQETSSMFMQLSQPILDNYQPVITATKLGDIDVLDVKPKGWRDNGKV